jgi:hypothetical protein
MAIADKRRKSSPASMTGPLPDPLLPPIPLGIDDADLVRRAVTYAGQDRPVPGSPRWAVVRDLFQIGGGYAIRLCQRFGLDPDESLGER